MRKKKWRYISKGIEIPIPSFSTLVNFFIMIIKLISWIYFGTRLNLVEKLGNLLAAIFDEAYCIKSAKTPNGEY